MTGRAIADLGPHDCRYPFGERAPYTFCGHPAVAGSSYCLPHKILCTKAVDHPRRGADAPHFSAVMRKGNVPACLVVTDGEGLL